MTADHPTDFPYEPAPVQDDPHMLRKYWSIAKGLQAVDDLKPSEYLEELSQETIDGTRTLAESGEAIRYYYLNLDEDGELADLRPLKGQLADSDIKMSVAQAGSKEADLVTQRIAELLSRGAFLFAPEMLSRIHAYLFQDLDPQVYRPGQFKEELLLKHEAILNGDSVLYADPMLMDAALRMAFEDEIGYEYGAAFDDGALEHLARFIARVWQVHPFVEGNTRTVAVFVVLYLNHLGYDLTNEPFEHHARYFRDALVRANYRNPKANAFPELTFLGHFLDGALNGFDEEEGLRFDSKELEVSLLFEDPSLIRHMPKMVNGEDANDS